MDLIESAEVEGSRLRIRASSDLRSRFLRSDFVAEYGDLELEALPQGILTIPLLTTALPIVWRFGLEADVANADAPFLRSMDDVRARLQEMYPLYTWRGTVRGGAAPAGEATESADDCTAVLFSGGVDSTFSALRAANHGTGIVLVTIWGNDVRLDEASGWSEVQRHAAEMAEALGGRSAWVRSNFREFLRSDVLDRALPEHRSWWGFVQHGVAVAGLAAPIVHGLGCERLLVAATHTPAFDSGWGSGPELEGRLRWTGATVEHDGFEVSRQEKIRYILEQAERRRFPQHLRVCYSRRSDAGRNCARCEKCLRTVAGLMLEGAHPRAWGFDLSAEDAVERIETGFAQRRFDMGDDELFMWRDLQARAPTSQATGAGRDLVRWLVRSDFEDYRKRGKARTLASLARSAVRRSSLARRVVRSARSTFGGRA